MDKSRGRRKEVQLKRWEVNIETYQNEGTRENERTNRRKKEEKKEKTEIREK